MHELDWTQEADCKQEAADRLRAEKKRKTKRQFKALLFDLKGQNLHDHFSLLSSSLAFHVPLQCLPFVALHPKIIFDLNAFAIIFSGLVPFGCKVFALIGMDLPSH